MKSANILIIEDDEDIREGVRILLEGEGYQVTEASNGIEGLNLLSDKTDLVILDIMMPGITGLRTCEEIRKTSFVPLLFLTAKSQESDKLIGLMAGGDDYLVKPFSYSELLARVTALLRRYRVYNQGQVPLKKNQKWIEKKGIRINTYQNEVYQNNKKIELTDIEYNMLLLMMQNSNKIFSAQNLYESIWNEPFLYTSSNTVMVHIRRLRIKIEENPQHPKMILTVWGKGYQFA